MARRDVTISDFDSLMPSSERRLDSILSAPEQSSAVIAASEIPQKVDAGSSPPPSSTIHHPSSLIVVNPAPDPRWPLLNRWSSTQQSPMIPSSTSPTTKLSVRGKDEKQLSSSVVNTASVPEISNRSTELSISRGAWEKPLVIQPASSLNLTEAPRSSELSNSHWPSLMVANQGTDSHSALTQKSAKEPISSEAEATSLKAHSSEYPWAARMNQSLRNLHRVTIPDYLEDGTPKVRTPSHVLLGGVENQKEFVVGQFYRCLAPSRGQIQAVVSMIWGRKCRIFIRKLGESTYLFHIPDESTRKWVLQRGLWHVDDCLMFVSPWSPTDTISVPEITTVPVWLTLNNIPDQLYSIMGIKWIASGIGEPMLTEKPWLDPTQMGKAKILVEVKLNRPFPQRVALADKSDTITMVEVLYSWLPSTCSGCGQLGHKVSRCLRLKSFDSRPADLNVDPKRNTKSIASDSHRTERSNSPSTTVVHSVIAGVETTPLVAGYASSPIAIIESVSLKQTNPTAIVTANSSINTQATLVSNNEPNAAAPAAATIAPGTMSLDSNILSPHVVTGGASKISPPTMVVTSETPIPTKASVSSANPVFRIQRSSSSSGLGSNRFASLDSSDEEDGTQVSDDDSDSLDIMTPMGKRILRERPVKPSTKAKEMHLHSIAAGRGNRGRGSRGGRG